jgi:site-specific recombinase XerC
LASPLQQFEDYLQHEKRYSAHTLGAYKCDLGQFEQWLDDKGVDDIANADSLSIRNWIASLHRQGIGGKTLQRKLSSLRSFYQFLIRKHLLKNNPAVDIRAPKTARTLPKTLDADTLTQLLEIDSNDILAVLDKTIMELFYSSGLRLSELVNLNLESLDMQEGSLRAIGKGNKTRILPIGRKAIKALKAWMHRRAEMANADINARFVGLKAGANYAESSFLLAYTNVLGSRDNEHNSLALPWDGTPLFTDMITSNDLFTSNYGAGMTSSGGYIAGTSGIKAGYTQKYDFTGVKGFKSVVSYAYYDNSNFTDAQQDINLVLAYGYSDFTLALKGIWVKNNAGNTAADTDVKAGETGASIAQIDHLDQYRVIANWKF